MEIKKSTKADLEGKRIYFFLIGLFLSAGLFWLTLEWKYGENNDMTEAGVLPVDSFITLDESIIITHQAYALQENEPAPLTYDATVTSAQHTEIFELVNNDSSSPLPEALLFEDFSIEEQMLHSTPYDYFEEAASLDAKSASDSSDTVLYTQVEELPEFPGGYAAFIQYLGKSIRYIQPAVVRQIRGKVVCSFVIDKTGRIEQVSLVESLDTSLDREVMRVINNMPAWKPGKNHGMAVRVKFVVPVSFRL